MSIILWRDRNRGNWMATYDDHTSAILPYSSAEKAGDVARAVQASNPKTDVGVKSSEFGYATVLAYGPVVWLGVRYKRDVIEAGGNAWDGGIIRYEDEEANEVLSR